MLSSKELKTIVGYIEKALYKKIGYWSTVSFDYIYECESDIFGDVLRVSVPVEYSIAKGRLSITKHDNKIFFGIENLIKVKIKEISLESAFRRHLWSGFNRCCKGSVQDISNLANRAYEMWCDSGGIDRMYNMISQKLSFKRGGFEIPCKGLDSKIIPIASLDLETMTLRYPKSKSGDFGTKVAVGDVIFTNIYSWNSSWNSPSFLEGVCLPDSLFFASNQYERLKDSFGIDKILLSVLHEKFPYKY